MYCLFREKTKKKQKQENEKNAKLGEASGMPESTTVLRRRKKNTAAELLLPLVFLHFLALQGWFLVVMEMFQRFGWPLEDRV